jgi:hypothetical protein
MSSSQSSADSSRVSDIDDAELNELLSDSSIATASVAGEHPDEAHIRELLRTSRTDDANPTPPVDIAQLKAMLAGMLQQKAGKSTGVDHRPANSRDALRMKLKQKQHSRMSKYAINVQTEKKTKATPQNDAT